MKGVGISSDRGQLVLHSLLPSATRQFLTQFSYSVDIWAVLRQTRQVSGLQNVKGREILTATLFTHFIPYGMYY